MTDEAEQERRYVAHIRLDLDESKLAERARNVLDIKEILERISNGNCRIAWTSEEGGSFAYFLKSARSARWIFEELWHPGQHGPRLPRDDKPAQSSPMRGRDKIIVLELGLDFSGNGWSGAWAWLQRE